MCKRNRKLLLASSIVGYVISFLYLFLTACLFSVGNYFYWLTLVLVLVSLYTSLYTGVLRGELEIKELEGKLKTKYIINLCLTISSLPSFVFNLVALLIKDKKEETKVEVKEERHCKLFKDKPKTSKKWYRKANFIIACSSLGGILLSSFVAQIGETSGYQVEVRDFTLTKEMTEQYNGGDENKLNGKNYVISDDMLHYGVTEYRPKVATETNPLPVIFVMPGFTRTKATMSQYAIEFSRRGAVVFTIDPGCQGATTAAGYKENEDGTKEMISSTVGANGLDYLVQYVYNNAEGFPYIDRDKIGAVGHSAGGGNVGQLAQDFAGSSYEESIIKALYVSGYIKVSLANRFKDLRCNAAMSYAYYDEGAFRYQGNTSAFEIIAKRFVNEVNGANLGYEEAEIDKEYGSMENGTYRVIHREMTNHCFEMYDASSITNTINFFRRTLDLDPNIKDSSHTWFVKEGFNGLALVSAFFFIFSLMAFLIDVVPFLSSFKKARKESEEYELSRAVKYGYKDKSVLESKNKELANSIHVTKKRFIDKILFWTTALVTTIIACLDYIPLARVTMDLYSDAASNTYTFNFPARMMNAVMLWAVVNGLVGLVLLFLVKIGENLYYKFTHQDEYISWYRFTMLKVGWKDLLKTLGLAAVIICLFFVLVHLSYAIFHQDFRFMMISAAPIQPRYMVTWLIYVLPFFIFYFSNSIRTNLSVATEGWDEWKVYLLSGVLNSIGLVFILVVNYVVYFKTGTVYYGYYGVNDTSEMWLYINMIFGLIPIMFALPIINRFCFKKSGNIYLGPIIACSIFIMMSLSASVSYIPM